MSFQGINNRDAYPTIRGFVYQADQTIVRWLKLADDEVLELEKGEDIDIVQRDLNKQEVSRELEQVKYRKSNITLTNPEVNEAIFNFFQHKITNPALKLSFRFVTNSSPTKEQPSLFEEDISGIVAWKKLAASKNDDYDSIYLKGIKRKLIALAQSVSEPSTDPVIKTKWNDWERYLASATDNDLLEFIRAFDWSTENPDSTGISEKIKQFLIDDNLVAEQSGAESFYQRLFLHVFKLLAKPGLKRLDRAKLIELQSEAALPVQDKGLLKILQSLFTDLKEEVKDLKDIVASHDKAISSVQSELKIVHDNRKVKLSIEVINERFQAASTDLQHCPATFENLPDSHIPRKETEALLTWIREPIKITSSRKSLSPEFATPIAILVGEAGYGKTTVMRDLLLALREQDTPVLGIKADRLAIPSRDELYKELQLGDDLNEITRTLTEKYDRFVVLIDQLDALSQSLSSDRNALYTYNREIERWALLPHVRIIVSCRLSDLQYDPVLKQYNEKHVVRMEPLTREEVESVFQQLNLPKEKLTTQLYELLKVPSHLNVFCMVYRNAADFAAFRTIQDLYHELWQQKILTVPATSPADQKKVISVVQKLADAMYQQQEISLAVLLYETEFFRELKYLQTQSVITQEGRKIQFFHQSFFDYAFARTFVEKGQSISADVLGTEEQPKHQGLFIRSKVRQVLVYLRELDPKAYIVEVHNLIDNPKYRFHLKLLTLQVVAFQPEPLQPEEKIVRETLFKDKVLKAAFIESIIHSKWFQILNNAQLLHHLLITEYVDIQGVVRQLCQRVQTQCPADVIRFLDSIPDFPERTQFIGNVLFTLETFAEPTAKTLFEKVVASAQVDDMWYFHVLENAAKTYPEWAAEKILQKVLIEMPEGSGSKTKYISVEQNNQHSFITSVEMLYQAAPEVAFNTVLKILEVIIEESRFLSQSSSSSYLYGDSAFWDIDPDNAYPNTQEELYAAPQI